MSQEIETSNMYANNANAAREEIRIGREERGRPPLSSLTNPTQQQLNSYTKNELQKHCDQLGLRGIWTNKGNLIEKLITYYRGIEDTQLSPDENRERENEREIPNPAELLHLFENFMRETRDNFLVVNNSLADKEKEIEELKTKLFFAEETIKHLQETLQNQNGSRTWQTLPHTPSEGNTLLIGDSCLKEVKSTDLHENIMIRTLPEANMNLLKSWIVEKLALAPKECIICCGTQDLLDEDQALENVLDSLGATVAELKEKNSEVNVKVCELIPAIENNFLNNRINQYNTKLSEWCNANGVTFIKTQEFFRLATGDLDINCYGSQGNENYDLINRIGAIRLLDAIASTCTEGFLSHNWKSIWSNLCNLKNNSLKVNDRRDERHDYMVNRRTESRNKLRSQQNRYQQSRDTNYPRSRRSYAGGQVNSDYMNTGVTNRERNDHYAYYDRHRYGCYNCGEFNHQQANCRFDHKIKCNICYEYGHKSRLCKQNIQY